MERGLPLLFPLSLFGAGLIYYCYSNRRLLPHGLPQKQWVHGNRHRKLLLDGDQYHQAKIVEGPAAKSHGKTPKEERPVPQVARDGTTVLTQICIKCPEVLSILASNKVEIEVID